MSNPTSDKQWPCSGIKIGRIIDNSRGMHQVPHMVQRHDDHDGTAEDIDGSDALGGDSGEVFHNGKQLGIKKYESRMHYISKVLHKRHRNWM